MSIRMQTRWTSSEENPFQSLVSGFCALLALHQLLGCRLQLQVMFVWSNILVSSRFVFQNPGRQEICLLQITRFWPGPGRHSRCYKYHRGRQFFLQRGGLEGRKFVSGFLNFWAGNSEFLMKLPKNFWNPLKAKAPEKLPQKKFGNSISEICRFGFLNFWVWISDWVEGFITLRSLQKTFVNFFLEFAWGFGGIENWRGFLVSFLWSRCFPGNKARKVLENFGENSKHFKEQNLGRIFENFGEISFCNFSDLRFY